jgi:serine phosphatase RsbU (regulator of sigma subunit)
MLGALHAALRRQPSGSDLCTVCIVTLERDAERARLTVTLAGHPPPLVIDADGERRHIGTPGTLLGVLDPLEISEVEVELRAGQTLLLYTDGLAEADRTGLELVEQVLFEPSSATSESTLAELLTQIEQAALARAGEWLHDDIALLALRLSRTVLR